MRADWMAGVLRVGGLKVREVPGWQTRGHGQLLGFRGVLLHHTAGARTGNFPSERVVVDGRPGLKGPLCNLGLARDGTWVIVAAGLAYHAGIGSHSLIGTSGNPYLLGVEAESTGTTDDWTPAQRESYPMGVAAILRHLKLPAARAIGHKEWAPRRKIDPAFWDMSTFRRDVARLMAAKTPGGPPAPPLPPGERTLGLTTPLTRGEDVRRFQLAAGRRYTRPPYWKLDADGIYGPDTVKWVRTFQGRAGLPVTGVLDVWTRAKFGAF